MAPTSSYGGNSREIAITSGGTGTGDSVHYCRDGSAWRSGPTVDMELKQALPTGVNRGVIQNGRIYGR